MSRALSWLIGSLVTLAACAAAEAEPPEPGGSAGILPGEGGSGSGAKNGAGGSAGDGGTTAHAGATASAGFPGAGSTSANGGTSNAGTTQNAGGASVGGKSAQGGGASTGGASPTGGSAPGAGTGGGTAAGGTSPGGGTSSTGGTGGTSSAGGMPSAGGMSASGGTGTAGTSAAGTTSSAGTTSAGGASTGGTGSGGSPAGGSATGPDCSLPGGYSDGSVTFYSFNQGSTAVNCSFEITSITPDTVAFVPFGGGKYFGAMNTGDYNNAATCGACVQVDRTDNGKSVQLMIVDQCPSSGNPKCTAGHIDMSKEAFLQIGTEAEGYLGTTNGGATGHIQWHYIACPDDSAVEFRLKEPTNQSWNEILVEGHRYPIKSVDVFVSGIWHPATRQSYNYWIVDSGAMGSPPYQVRATDVNGSVVEASLPLASGDLPGTAQFPVCQ